MSHICASSDLPQTRKDVSCSLKYVDRVTTSSPGCEAFEEYAIIRSAVLSNALLRVRAAASDMNGSGWQSIWISGQRVEAEPSALEQEAENKSFSRVVGSDVKGTLLSVGKNPQSCRSRSTHSASLVTRWKRGMSPRKLW